MIAFRGHFHVLAERLLVAGPERVAEGVHLAAGIVKVIFLGHVVAGGGHDIAEACSPGRRRGRARHAGARWG